MRCKILNQLSYLVGIDSRLLLNEINKEFHMTTLFQFHRANYLPAEKQHHKLDTSHWQTVLGRCLFSLIFILSGFNHFSSGSISYADRQGIPMADVLVPISGLIALMGGVSILSGYHVRVGAVLILIFMLPVTFLMHNFWAISDPEMAQMQLIHFLKNLSIIGGALLLSAKRNPREKFSS
jgi:putative oxidoreductase